MTAEFWGYLRTHLLGSVPVMLVYLVAFVCALLLRRRCTKAATLAAIGSAVLFLNAFLGPFFLACFASMHRSGAIAGNQYGAILTIVVMVRSLSIMAGFALVFAAVFAGRAKPPAPPPVPPRA